MSCRQDAKTHRSYPRHIGRRCRGGHKTHDKGVTLDHGTGGVTLDIDHDDHHGELP